jgi:hypothetical protein
MQEMGKYHEESTSFTPDTQVGWKATTWLHPGWITGAARGEKASLQPPLTWEKEGGFSMSVHRK